VLAQKATLAEIQQHWTLDHVFTACDKLAQYADLATYQRPRPKAQPRRQDDAWARADQVAMLGAKRPG